MLRFNVIEVINKIIGFVITALLARLLTSDFGTYLYYQTIFSYLYAFTLFSSDYNFLVNYKIDKSYVGSASYYQTIFIKCVLIFTALIFSLIFLIPHFTKFAFWPYLVSVLATLFVYDFILYVEDKKKELILFRFLSQLATLAGVLLFYFKLLDAYYVTIIQAVQTIILTTGTFIAARKYLPEKFKWHSFMEAIKKFKPGTAVEVSSYFLLRNFIIFFTTIETIILSQRSMLTERDIFAEGMRLSGTLMPFALFYINFNINKIKKGYYTIITLIGLLLIIISPVYVYVFMGENFIDRTYYYNFFIWVFLFTAFLEKDYIELLTQDNRQKNKLLLFNILYFFISVLLFILFLYTSASMQIIIIVFTSKLLLYYILLIYQFNLKLRYIGVISAFISLIMCNVVLYYFGYYQYIFKEIIYLKNQL